MPQHPAQLPADALHERLAELPSSATVPPERELTIWLPSAGGAPLPLREQRAAGAELPAGDPALAPWRVGGLLLEPGQAIEALRARRADSADAAGAAPPSPSEQTPALSELLASFDEPGPELARLRLAGVSARLRLAGVSARLRLAGVSARLRLAGVSARLRLAGVSAPSLRSGAGVSARLRLAGVSHIRSAGGHRIMQ